MPKPKQQSTTHRGTVLDPRQQGLRAFQNGRFDQAITAWLPLATQDDVVARALAEAYARRSRSKPIGSEQIADLEQACALVPDDLSYQYQLGLTLHRAGDLAAAIECYRVVLAQDSGSANVAHVLALALLEQDQNIDLKTITSGHPQLEAVLAPVQALLQGRRPEADETAVGQLWQGLGAIAEDDNSADTKLNTSRPLPGTQASIVRRYYWGVASVRNGDTSTALEAWQRVYREETRSQMPGHRPWLLHNLAALQTQQLNAQLEADEVDQATTTALDTFEVPLGNATLNSLVVESLDRGAHAAAGVGDWSRAAVLWEHARQAIAGSAGLGSPRPLLHNLAVTYETLERWTDAAEAWRALLRTKPRSGTAQQRSVSSEDTVVAGPTVEQWAWVRKRVIECYKRAGQPGEAVTVFRQAIKAEPHDLELRFQLVDALVANEQDQAAINELRRVLELDPQHVEAQLRMADVYSSRGEWYEAEETLRAVVDQHPDRADTRKHLAQLLLLRGQRDHSFGFLKSAEQAYTEGRQLAPDDYRFPLHLARIALDQRNVEQARTLLERTLQLASDQPDAYLQVIDCWAVADDIAAAREVLEQAEAKLKLGPEFFISLATLLLDREPPSSTMMPFTRVQPTKPVEDDWSRLAAEMLDRAIALRPDDGRMHFVIASELVRLRADIALRYAEAGSQMLPDDLQGLTLLGLLQALNDQKREAKKTLTRAGRLARQEGNTDLVQHIEMMRQQIDSPFLRLALEMGPLMDDLDDDDVDHDDLYW